MDSLSSGKLGDWVAALDLSASASQNLVELLMGDVYGATSKADLLELEDVHIQAIKDTLPIARQNRFVRAIKELREVDFPSPSPRRSITAHAGSAVGGGREAGN